MESLEGSETATGLWEQLLSGTTALSDLLFEDMGITDSDGKNKFLNLCEELFRKEEEEESMPIAFNMKKVVLNEIMILASILVQVGMIDLQETNDSSVRTPLYLTNVRDMDERIVKLILWSPLEGQGIDIPQNVFRLNHLHSLVCCHAKSLPLKELSLLPNLKELKLRGCFPEISKSFADTPESVKFSNLTSLKIDGFYDGFSSGYFNISFVSPMIHRCLALEILELECHKDMDIDNALSALRSWDTISTQTLRRLSLDLYLRDTNGNHLEAIFFEVLLRFANLEELHLRSLTTKNNGAFKTVADRIRNDDHCKISKSLRQVRLKGIHMNKKDLLTFLNTFVTVDDLHLTPTKPFFDRDPYHKDVKDALFANLVGRRAWKGCDKRSESHYLPLSVWPLVLQRAQRKLANGLERVIDTTYLRSQYCGSAREQPYFQSNAEGMATGIYYLLREGPVLFNSINNDSNNNIDNNIDNNNNDRGLRRPSSSQQRLSRGSCVRCVKAALQAWPQYIPFPFPFPFPFPCVASPHLRVPGT